MVMQHRSAADQQPMAAGKPRKPGLSPRQRLRRLDGRSRAARFLKSTEAALVEHLGGPERVSVAQRILVERVAADLLRIEQLDEKAAAGTMTERDGVIAHALRNSVRLALKDIGLEAVEARPPTLSEYWAGRVAEREAAESAQEGAESGEGEP